MRRPSAAHLTVTVGPVPKMAVIAKIKAKPGKFDALVARCEAMLHQVESETETEVWTFNVTGPDEGEVWFYEVFTDPEAFEVHAVTEAMAHFAKDLGDLAEPEIESHTVTPRGAKGVPALG